MLTEFPTDLPISERMRVLKDYMIGKSGKGNPVYPGSPTNDHRSLVGTTGSGKSTAAMRLILDALGNGDRVIVFNTRDSLDPKLLGARAPLYELQRKVIKPAFEGIRIPLFSPFTSSDDVIEPTALMVSRISKMLAQSAGLSDAQQRKLQQAVPLKSFSRAAALPRKPFRSWHYSSIITCFRMVTFSHPTICQFWRLMLTISI